MNLKINCEVHILDQILTMKKYGRGQLLLMERIKGTFGLRGVFFWNATIQVCIAEV